MGTGRNVLTSYATLAVRKGLRVLNNTHVINQICRPVKIQGNAHVTAFKSLLLKFWFIQLNFNINR